MGGIFKQGKWIWLRKSGINQYADFVCKFYAENTEGLTLRVSADTDYAVSDGSLSVKNKTSNSCGALRAVGDCLILTAA